MGKIISVHSFRGGTGKSNVTANLAATLARGGRRVGIIDTDIQSPGIHVLFGLDQGKLAHTLNSYLWGECAIDEAACDVSGTLGKGVAGSLMLVPSSISGGDIARILRDGYDVSLLNDGFDELLDRLRLDYLFVDTHPGVNSETLLSTALSDVLVILLRPDQQDYQGTAVTVDVSRKLEVPRMLLVVNKLPAQLNALDLRKQLEAALDVPVAGMLPLSEELVLLGSADLFSVQHPDHPWSAELRAVAAQLAS